MANIALIQLAADMVLRTLKAELEADDFGREYSDVQTRYEFNSKSVVRPCTFPHCSCEEHCDTGE